MAIKFGELKGVVIRLLADEIDPNSTTVIMGMTTSAELLKDAINSGLKAILPWAWKTAIATIPAGISLFELPSNVYRIDGVFDDENDSYLSEEMLAAGTLRASKSGNSWLEFPEGYITFKTTLADGGILYYAATWEEPILDDSLIETPVTVIPGLVYYATSYCLLPKALSTGTLGQYKMKVDSGVPTDNPILDMSNAFMKRFEIEMSRIYSRTKGIKS